MVVAWLLILSAFMVGCGDPHEEAPIVSDADHLRTIAGLWCQYRDTPVAQDGRIDVFALARKRMEDGRPPSRQSIVSAFSSERLGRGPTWNQIRDGDYSSFAWERFRGTPPPGDVVPILWEPLPTEDERALVAYSDGMVREIDASELKQLLQNLGQ